MVWISRWNSPKRKEDNENAVRRALLAGAFAAGASGLLTRKALADTPYTSFAYPLSSLPSMRQATATRTSLQRFADVFNVKDFGALGNNSHDDTAAIQAAINAALDNWGGIVYFPAGRYRITRRLEVGTGTRANNGASLTFLGTGSHFAYEGGSMIKGEFHDYLLYISATGHSVKSIQGLAFKNSADFSFTSTLPPGNPDNLMQGGWAKNVPIPASELNGGGCVYVGEGNGTGFTVINCDLSTKSGICLHLANYCSTVIGTKFSGGGWNGNVSRSFGITAIGAFQINACKMYELGTCISVFNNASVEASYLNMEVSGIAFRLGSNPVGFWYSNPPTYFGPFNNLGGSSGQVHLRGCVIESMRNNFIEIDNCHQLTIDGMVMAGLEATPPNGIWIGYLQDARIANLEVSGPFTNAAIDVCSHGSGKIGNIMFENVQASAYAPTPAWKLPTSNAYNGDKNPVTYINCNTDGAVPLSQLPTGMEFMSGHPVMIKDSVDPLWTGTASNVGKPAVGGGTNKVLVRWNPLSARWVLAG
jgi:hypothetical protein